MMTTARTIQPSISESSYAWARRAHRVFLSIFLCLCLRIFLRRFLITEPNLPPRRASVPEGDPGGESYRKRPARRPLPTLSLNGHDVLHGRPRRAPPPHPEVPRRRGPAAPRRVGGDHLPRLHLQALRRARLPRPALPARVRRPGRRLLFGGRPLRGDGEGGPGRAGHGRRRPDRAGHAAGV